jgi:MFS family permease
MAEAKAVTWRQLLDGSYLLPLTAICLGITLHAVNIPLTATILPSAVAEIGGLEFLSWAATVYLVASLLTSVSGARLRRRLGSGRAYAVAGSLFAAGSLICALSPTMGVMLAGRTLQGAGGGLILALGYALIRSAFPEALWARIFALVSGIWGAAAVLGAFIGGLFADLWSWRGAYYVMLPLALLLIALAWVGLSEGGQRDAPAGPYPFRRLLLLLAIAASGNLPAPVWRLGLIAASLPPILLALRLDARASNRLLPRHAFSPRAVVGLGLWLAFLLMLALTAFSVYGPVLLQSLHGTSATVAGAFVAWSSLSWTIAALIAASLPAPPERAALVAGPAVMLTGLVGLALALPAAPLWLIALLVFCLGGGIGLGWAFICKRILSFAAEGEGDVAATSIPTTQMFGFAFGAALSGLIANAAGFAEALTAATAATVANWLFLGFAVAAAAALAAALRLVALERAADRPVSAGRVIS